MKIPQNQIMNVKFDDPNDAKKEEWEEHNFPGIPEVQIGEDVEEPLESFRRQWEAELSGRATSPSTQTSNETSVDVSFGTLSLSAFPLLNHRDTDNTVQQMPPTATALDLYVAGTRFERAGDLSGAMESYRKAFRLDPEVDRNFSLAYSNNELPITDQPAAGFYTYYNFEEVKASSIAIEESGAQGNVPDASLHPLLVQFLASQCRIDCQTDLRPCYIAALPEFVILRIMEFSISRDIAVLKKWASICKKFFCLTRQQALWKQLCSRVSLNAHPAWDISHFVQDWFQAYRYWPRIRMDGIYISRINYIRQGDNASFYKPVHLVTYYRFLRFLPNFNVVCLTSSMEPKEVVSMLATPSASIKGLMVGHMSFRLPEAADLTSQSDVLDLVLHDSNRPGVTFEWSLGLRQTQAGRHNKLSWLSNNVVSILRNTSSSVPSSQLKPFFFSKVKSYVHSR